MKKKKMIGFIDNFLKVEKEHVGNLGNLRSIQDLKFPFQFDQLNKL